MKTVKAGYSIIDETNISKKIEKIARTCYKSEDKICEGSDEKMIANLVKRQHFAMLEHGSVCVHVPATLYKHIDRVRCWMAERVEWVTREKIDDPLVQRSVYPCFLHMTYNSPNDRYLVSGNIRAWIDFFTAWCSYDSSQGDTPVSSNLYHAVSEQCPAAFKECDQYFHNCMFEGSLDFSCSGKVITDFSSISREERMVHEDLSVLFTCDRGVTHELVRHRPVSFAQESTRYCNYHSDKNDNQVTFILPLFYDNPDRDGEYNVWRSAMEDAERYYLGLIERGSKPQEARSVLPNSTKSDIVLTANLREWRHIFSLRACDVTGPAHPQMHEIMQPLLRECRTLRGFAFGDMVMPGETPK